MIKGGISEIRKKADSFLEMSTNGLYTLVFVDLDNNDCAPTLLREWFSVKNNSIATLPERLIFRVAVREIESWIMADRSNLASYLKIPVDNFPLAPDEIPDPKRKLLSVIESKGKRRWLEEMLPQGRTASIGPSYNEKLCDFVAERWSPDQAAQNSPSLRRAIAALKRS